MANKLFTVRRSERNAPPGPTKTAPAARRAAERDARRTAQPEGTRA